MMFSRLKILKKEAVSAEADVACQRRDVKLACATTILSAERLADKIEPQRVVLRRMGISTILPAGILAPAREVIEMAKEMRRHAAATPIEEGLLGWRRDP